VPQAKHHVAVRQNLAIRHGLAMIPDGFYLTLRRCAERGPQWRDLLRYLSSP
jgi:hypothetical protein